MFHFFFNTFIFIIVFYVTFRKRKYYIGDFKSVDNIESPNSPQKLFIAAKRFNEKHVSTIKKQRIQNYSLQQNISNFKQLIDHLKNENCFSFLKV